MNQDTVLEIRNITKVIGSNKILDNLTIPHVKRGEFVTFLGPSGCGKTTLLRMIGGFYYPTSGEILMNGKVINNLPPEKRKTSMVFQNYALFPHMTVFENVGYGLKLRKFSKAEIKQKVNDMLQVVQLTGMQERKPSQMSGGQQQRVALARSLVIGPEVILMDEPLSNLDTKLRESMRDEIRKIQQTLNLTCIFVTHDQQEAFGISDRIVVMNKGKIEQIGTPSEIYEKPATIFVASFVGTTNFIQGKIQSRHQNKITIATALGELYLEDDGTVSANVGDTVTIVIRPESLQLQDPTDTTEPNTCSATVHNCVYSGATIRYTVQIPSMETPFVVDAIYLAGQKKFAKGDKVKVILPSNFHLIPQIAVENLRNPKKLEHLT